MAIMEIVESLKGFEIQVVMGIFTASFALYALIIRNTMNSKHNSKRLDKIESKFDQLLLVMSDRDCLKKQNEALQRELDDLKRR